jgi:hypothetical protein
LFPEISHPLAQLELRTGVVGEGSRRFQAIVAGDVAAASIWSPRVACSKILNCIS